MRSARSNMILIIVIGVLLGSVNCWAGGSTVRRIRVNEDMRALATARASCAHNWSWGRSHMMLEALPIAAQLGGFALIWYCHRQLPHAFQYANRGAKMHDPLAEAMLGTMEAAGIPDILLAADAKAALHWNLAAARMGFPLGEYQLGVDLWHGVGGPRDGPGAIRWMKRASASGSKEAQRWLASHKTNSPQTTRVAAATPPKPPAVQTAAPSVPVAQGTAAVPSPVANDGQRPRSLKRFWTLYFQASHAQVVDFGEPALLRPVGFGTTP